MTPLAISAALAVEVVLESAVHGPSAGLCSPRRTQSCAAEVSVYLHSEAMTAYARMCRHPRRARRRHVRPTSEPWRRRRRSAPGCAGRRTRRRGRGHRSRAGRSRRRCASARARRAPRADPADAGRDARAARRRAHHHRRAGGQARGQRGRAVPPLRQQGADVRGPDRVHRAERVHAGQPDRRARDRRRACRRSDRSPCCCSSARRTRA